MRLPNPAFAQLGDKIREYSLNSQHPTGRQKARVFASALGLTSADAAELEQAVMHAASESDAALEKGDLGYGMTYELRFRMTTAHGSATVLTGWIVRPEEGFPRLTTCYIVSTQ